MRKTELGRSAGEPAAPLTLEFARTAGIVRVRYEKTVRLRNWVLCTEMVVVSERGKKKEAIICSTEEVPSTRPAAAGKWKRWRIEFRSFAYVRHPFVGFWFF